MFKWNSITDNKILFLKFLGILIPIIAFLIIFLQNQFNNQSRILKYTVISGVLWSGGSNHLYLIALSGLILGILNIKLHNQLDVHFDFLKKSILVVNVFIQIVLFSALLLLFWIN